MAKIRELCAEHLVEYIEDYGDDGEAVLAAGDYCDVCDRHAGNCICADCSGAELTADND
jgi:hypothetical protein